MGDHQNLSDASRWESLLLIHKNGERAVGSSSLELGCQMGSGDIAPILGNCTARFISCARGHTRHCPSLTLHVPQDPHVLPALPP